jgi:hypothetical protein
MAHHTTHDTLGSVERNEEDINVFSKSLDDRDVPSLCQISGVRVSGRQFFPCEGIRQAKKLFEVRFSITVVRTKLKLVNNSVIENDIMSDRFIYLYFCLLKQDCDHLKAQIQIAKLCFRYQKRCFWKNLNVDF